MRKLILYPALLLLPLVMAGCSEERFAGPDPETGTGHQIKLQAAIDQLNMSRANDAGFADGDRIGVYAVAFGSEGNPGDLEPQGNLATNLAFTYDGADNTWTGDRSIYFPDDRTPVDFYSYYPYTYEIADPESYPVTVARNQSEEAAGGKLSAYEQSDLLWGKSGGVTPATPLVSITMKHILAGVMVTLVEGEGFDQGEWTGLEKSVLVDGTVTSGIADLSTGEVAVAGDTRPTAVTAVAHGDSYRAIVIPQTVGDATGLLIINVGSDSYIFTKDIPMTYIPGKLHKFTIVVDKQVPDGKYVFTLMNEAITAWESDALSHDGKVKEYVVVNVPEAGQICRAIEDAGLKASEIRNLKITGEINGDDFRYLRENIKYLEALNIKEVTLKHSEWVDYFGKEIDRVIPSRACHGMKYLSTVVLPDKMAGIGEDAFRSTNLTGSIELPEGVIYVGGSAFSNWQDYTTSNTNLSGTLKLPTTLKYIGGAAFRNCDFTGELILPEGLECIEGEAFTDCENFTGELHLPHSLKRLGWHSLDNMKGIRGTLQIPRGLTEIEAYGYLPMSSIIWPEAPEKISDEAFWNYPLKGDLVVPETVTHIGRCAFAGTKLSHITLPRNLEFLEDAVCSDMSNLLDTIIIPPLIEIIGERAFANCQKLEAVIIPERVERIKGRAFENCFSLNYIRCDAKTPPEVEESAFYGIAKDNFTVEVPEESVDAYRNAPGWSEFKRIAAYRNFIARPSKYNVLNKGGKKEIILNADAEWELAECPSWCHVDKQSGNKKSTLNLTVDAMTRGAAPRSGRVTFRLKGDHDYLTHIDVGQYDYEYDEDSYIQLQKATKGAGIDLVFVGDGYDALDISSGIYMNDMRQEMEYLFAVEPYITYRDYFNVYTPIALSEDSGTEDRNHWRNTKFHGAIWDNDVRVKIDWEDALDYCWKTVTPVYGKTDPKLGVILLMNTEQYEGVTYALLEQESFCAVVTKSTESYPNDARGILQHEAGGHGIGWLGDEYMYHAAFIQKCTCICCDHTDDLLANHSSGFALNLSLEGKYSTVPWSHLIYNPSYSDIVDVYEGGYFHSRGVYRSEKNSCMNNNVPYFSTWSRQLIVQRIMKLAGEEFSLDSFYALDKRDKGKDFTSTTRSDAAPAAGGPHGLPPVIIKDFRFGKKGGKK